MEDTINRAIAWVRRHVFLRSDHLVDSAGAADKGRPILTDANGQIDATLLAAATLLAKMLTVDGTGSGLDADKLDGTEGSSYQLASGYTAADVLAKLLTVDGTGSGLDADTLDTYEAAAFALLAGRSGGQTLYGGANSGDDLYLRSTSNATKGDVILDQGNVAVGHSGPEAPLDVKQQAHAGEVLLLKSHDYAAGSTGEYGRVAADSGAIKVECGKTGGTVWGDVLLAPSGGNVGVAEATPTISDGAGLHIGGKILRLDTSKSPASNGTGNAGEICWDSSYLYVCTATDTWKRVALTGGY